jgi:flagellar hook protein FlgE
MVGALWTGISGLSGSQTGLDNESNNIANVNTIGYKASRVSFADQMYQDKIGKGVTSFDVEKMYTQGNLKNTGVSYDMALSGDGFFQVSNGSDTYYTRAGNFRMGESGKLENVGQNAVQGWAMSPVNDDNRLSTDLNATYFTNDFTKVLGNKIIRDTSSIETIIAKATDYTATAVSDVQSVYSGAGYKTASTKIADIEALVTEYNKLLTTHANADPKPTASISDVQQNYLNFNLDTVALAAGDELYVYIDGQKYSQSFDTDEATTIKMFSDVLSNVKGFNAHYTNGIEDNPANTVKEGTYEYDNATSNPKGGVYLEGIIPGQSFRITEFGWTDASNKNQATKGEVKTIKEAVQGTGTGAIESVEKALAEAVSGKQQDVYSATEIVLPTSSNPETFTFSVDSAFSELGSDAKFDFDGATQVSFVAGDTATDVATKIAAETYANWTTTVVGDKVVFTSKTDADVADPVLGGNVVWTAGTANTNGGAENISSHTDGIALNTDANDFTYQINIYDKDLKTNVTIPAQPLEMDDMATIDEMVAKINEVKDTVDGKADNTELAYYVKAFNINGNLVVKTLDKNYDVEFTGELNGPIPEQQTIKLSGTVALKERQTMPITGTVDDGVGGNPAGTPLNVTFLGGTVSVLKGDTAEQFLDKLILQKSTVITAYNALGANDDIREIEDIIKTDAGNIEIIYKAMQPGASTDGNLVNIAVAGAASIGILQGASTPIVEGDLYTTFLGHNINGSADGDSPSSTVGKIIVDKVNIMNTWNAANPSKMITDIIKVSSDEIKLVYKNTAGDISGIVANTDRGMTFGDSEELVKGELTGSITKNINYSGREGAGAEFLKITTSINQKASKSDIQLKLDSLALTDSAFGSFSVDDTGLVTMQQDGVNFAVGQIAVARFTDNRGLEAVGDNLLKETSRSGIALFNTNNDKTADVKGGTLELSTADLSESLVNLMVFQRAFEANAKSITTADQILTTLIALKR